MSARRLALGAAQWGLDYGIANRTGRPDDAVVAEILRIARDAGVDTIDTAAAYGDSEAVIGRLVGADPYWKVVTKLRPDLFAPDRDASATARAARESLDASLRALQRDTLDAVLLHRWTDDEASRTAALDALEAAGSAGRVGRLGVSVLTAAEHARALAEPRIALVQCPAHLLDARFVAPGGPAPSAGAAIHTRSAFFQGVAFLDPSALPPHLEPARPPLAALRALARALDVAPAALWLAWALHLPTERVIVGCERAEQLAANLEALSHAAAVLDAVRDFAATRPDLPDAVLDPWRWPPRAPEAPPPPQTP